MTKTTLKHKPDCIFCQIVEHKLPSKIVDENENFIAFYDINPTSKGHTLVIPKKHLDDLHQLVSQEDADFIKAYLEFVDKVRLKLTETYHPKGVKVLFNTDGLIEVVHLHCHLVPLY